MSDTTDEMEYLSGELENYLEEQEESECICNKGMHDGKRIDCNCKICHAVKEE